MNTSFTPGPWRSTRHSHNMVKVENKDRVIFDGFHGEEGNALLAAAAPELLHSLREVLKWSDEWSIPEEVLTDAYAALKKATQPNP